MPNASRSSLSNLGTHCGAITGVLIWSLAGALTAGCGDDDGPPPVVFPDGGVDSGGGAGGSGGASGGDGGPLPVDGAVPDAGGLGLMGPCIAQDSTIRSYPVRELLPQAAPSLTVDALSFSLVFAGMDACAEAVNVVTMPSSLSQTTERAAIRDCSDARNGVGFKSGDSRWLVAWIDTRSNGRQIYADVFNSTVVPPDLPPIPPPRVPLSTSSSNKGALALAPLSDDTTVLLAWAEQTNDRANGALLVRPLQRSDATSAVDITTVRQEPGELYSAVTMTALPNNEALLGYVAGSGARRSLFIQKLDATGAPIGDRQELANDGDAFSTLSIAVTEGRGAVAYGANPGGTRPMVRWQALDANAQMLGTSRQLTTTLERAAGVGITVTASGYAVAYRAVSDFNWDFARIRVANLNDVGNRVGTGAQDVAETTDQGGAPNIAIALDGRLALSWFDETEGGDRTLKFLRYPCNR